MKSAMKLLTKKEPEKNLLVALKKHAGRNRTGRVTVRHRGGGAKRYYRLIEFGQERLNEEAKVGALEYDPNRTCFIALLEYGNGEKKYILAPHGLKVGDAVIFAEKTALSIGNRMKLKNIPVGAMVHNIELMPGQGGKMARSAGAGCQVMAYEEGYTHLKMPSGEIRKVLGECFASIGGLSNPEHRFQEIGKAGRARLKGRRPSVRGSAMNACDHPHGGGKNKQPLGRHPRTPWGKPALGVKTRRKRWTDKLILQRRKKK